MEGNRGTDNHQDEQGAFAHHYKKKKKGKRQKIGEGAGVEQCALPPSEEPKSWKGVKAMAAGAADYEVLLWREDGEAKAVQARHRRVVRPEQCDRDLHWNGSCGRRVLYRLEAKRQPRRPRIRLRGSGSTPLGPEVLGTRVAGGDKND